MSALMGKPENIARIELFRFDPERTFSSRPPRRIEALGRAVSSDRRDAAPPQRACAWTADSGKSSIISMGWEFVASRLSRRAFGALHGAPCREAVTG